MIDHVVIGLNRAFGRINGGKVDAITVVTVNQIVMHVEIKLVSTGLVGGTAARTTKRRRMKLDGATGVVIMNMVPANINVIGIRAEIYGVVEL